LPGPNVDGIILPTAIRRERLTEHETTGKIGYFCSYVPKEIIYALGKTPVRVLPAASKASAAEAFLPRNFCSLVKVTLASFLEGGSDLEGVVHSDSCDGLRRLHDVWRRYVGVEALHLLDLPRNDTPVSQDYYAHALGKLVKKLENRYEVKLTAERLSSSIHRYNEQRALVAELEHGWGAGQIGTETYLGLRRACVTEDPLLVNARLRDALDNSRSEVSKPPQKTRVMIVGSLLTNDQLYRAIEECGALVVAEDSCASGREQASQVAASGDVDEMLHNLATAYLSKPPCPRMRDFPRRMAYLSRLVTEHQVSGVVAFLYKFCDLFMSEYPVLRETLRGLDVPVLLLEDEGESALSGQHRTRLEAILEVLQ
jgi:benzoyl-CoA reductase subunit C